MKTFSILTSDWRSLGLHVNRIQSAFLPAVILVSGLGIALPAIAGMKPTADIRLAQTQIPAPPMTSGSGTSTGTQYVVYVDGNDPILLAQVRQLQPDAFPTLLSGRSVIQAGRFNSYQNAQQQANTLANQGVGVDIAEVPATTISYTEPVPSAPNYTSGEPLPPLPSVPVPTTPGGMPASQVSAASPNVEFGQPPNFPQAAPTNGTPGAPMNVAPPASQPNQAVGPTTTFNQEAAPYYVVIPAAYQDLPGISSRLIQLGTPAAQVQNRTQPLGPHVAVGPFSDRSLANQWSNFFRDAGYRSSRVHFDR